MSGDLTEEMKDKDREAEIPERKRRRWPLVLLAAVLAWTLFAPDWITEKAVEKILMAKLNDPETGVSCERVRFSGFSYWRLIRRRDPGKLAINGLRYRVEGLRESGTVENEVIRLNLRVARESGDGDGRVTVSGGGNALDWGLSIRGKTDLAWSGPASVAGDIRAVLLDGGEETPYCVDVGFAASADGWRARARVPEFEFSGEDAVAGRLASRNVPESVSNLVFRGRISADVSVRQTNAMPVAAWSVSVPVRSVSASADVADSRFAVDGLSMRPSLTGLADHIDAAPVRVRAERLDIAGAVLADVRADIRNDSKKLLVTEASAGICGGTASLYALSLDPERLNAGFTLFVDNIDAGEALSHISGLKGEATGRLHGRVPIRLRNGLDIRLGDAFLYSTPGETGTLRLEDASLVVDELGAGGVDSATCRNISRALADLKYKVFGLTLRNSSAGGGDATLTIRLDGSATDGAKTVPVDITVNVNGPIERLLNFGIRASTLK